MNWLFFVILGLAILGGFIGYKIGFAKMMFSLASFVAAIIIAWLVSPFAEKLIIDHTNLQKTIAVKLEETAFSNLESGEELTEKLNELPLPASVRESIEKAVQGDEGVTPKEALSLRVAAIIIRVGVVIVLFILARILIAVLEKLLGLINRLPGFREVNAAFGALLAIVEFFLVLFGFFLVVILFSGTAFSETVTALIEENRILSFLFHNNPLVFLFNLAKQALLK